MIKQIIAVLTLFALLLSTAAIHAPAMRADPTDANEQAAFCRAIDDAGGLDPAGLTRGECLNLARGTASAGANNQVAAICGLTEVQEELGLASKGQCVALFQSGTSSP